MSQPCGSFSNWRSKIRNEDCKFKMNAFENQNSNNRYISGYNESNSIQRKKLQTQLKCADMSRLTRAQIWAFIAKGYTVGFT